MTPTLELLDSCALLNLYATGRLREIAFSRSGRFHIVDIVRREAAYVLKGGTGPDARDRITNVPFQSTCSERCCWMCAQELATIPTVRTPNMNGGRASSTRRYLTPKKYKQPPRGVAFVPFMGPVLLVAHTGFEPVVSSLRGRCPGPLDECAARRLPLRLPGEAT